MGFLLIILLVRPSFFLIFFSLLRPIHTPPPPMIDILTSFIQERPSEPSSEASTPAKETSYLPPDAQSTSPDVRIILLYLLPTLSLMMEDRYVERMEDIS